MSNPDILILGGGLAGLAVAHALGGRGLRVRLVEQGPQLGAEASAQNAAMARRLVLSAPERALAQVSVPLLAAPPWEGPPLLRRTGGLVGVVDPAALPPYEAVARALVAAGVAVERPTAADLPPALRGAALAGAFLLPDDGLVDVDALVQGFSRAARAGGVEIHSGRRAGRLLREGPRVIGAEIDGEPVFAGATVLAGGAWTPHLLEAAGLGLPLRPLARHLLQSEAHPLSSADHPWCWLDDVGLYVRPEGGGWLCSPCDERQRAPAPGPGSAGPVEDAGRDLLARKLLTHLPALGELRLRGGWTGLRTFFVDRHPLLGPDLRAPGLTLAAGLGGCGVSVAFAAGALVAASLCGTAPPVGLNPADFSPGRPVQELRHGA